MNAQVPPGPKLNAFLVGVSDYPNLVADEHQVPPPHHLGLRPLSSAATAAYRVYQWLNANAAALAVPLGSCELLLSPSKLEAGTGLQGVAKSATVENFEAAANAWRDAARTHRDNIALFYFAGHGLIRKKGEQAQVLLMEGFGDTPNKVLRCGLEASNLISGMGSLSAKDTMARTQLFILDACRTLPEEVTKYEELEAQSIWDIPGPVPGEPYLDDRLAPVFYTAEPGALAFGIKGVGSVFGEALLRCLNGGAGTLHQARKWAVTVSSLIRAMPSQLEIVNREYGTKQTARTTDLGPDAILRVLEKAPTVDVEITVEPAERRALTRVSVSDKDDETVRDIPAPFPVVHRDQVAAGSYRITAFAEQPVRQFVTATPPFSPWPVSLE